MTDDESVAAGSSRRRSRGSETDSSRAKALKRLKDIQSGGRRSEAYEIKIEKPVYDLIEEDEYDALVAKRKEEANGFIVDDDGTGYGDEGEEEDWSKRHMPFSSDESDDGERKPESSRKKKNKKDVEKREKVKESREKKSNAANLVDANAKRISEMFTSSVFKKISRDSSDKSSKGVEIGSIVDDVIAQFAPDEGDRERRRRNQQSAGLIVNSTVRQSISTKFDKVESKPVENWFDCNGNVNAVDDFVAKEETVKEIEEPRVELDNGVVMKDEENAVNDKGLEVKEEKILEPLLEEEKVTCVLNAKISNEAKDPALNANAGWKEAIGNGGGIVDNTLKNENDKAHSKFLLDADGSLPFYIIDAYEERTSMGTVYLFGKVKAETEDPATGTVRREYSSCCVVVKNMQRCVYAIPNDSIFHTDEMVKLEKDYEESRISPSDFRTKLHDMASGMKSEITKHLLKIHVSSFSMAPVKRRYAFERSDVPAGENYMLKINYPFKNEPLEADVKGETFSTVLGTHNSALELFLVKRKVKGPSWLSVSKFSSSAERVSWCRFEITVDSPKDICVLSSSMSTLEIPPLTVTAINLRTIVNPKQNVNEIVSVSVISCPEAKIDTPMLASERKKPGFLSHFTIVRKLDGCIFPMGFTKEAKDRNSIICESSERALLNCLMVKLEKLDSDVLVGHNISGFDMDVLMHRAQACKVPKWSSIGRLRRSGRPNLPKGNRTFGSGASPGIMSCIAGRLLCDTYLCSRDLLREVSYSLTQLSKTQLNKDRMEVAPQDIPKMFQSSESLMKLLECGETDAWLSLELMFHLSVLPLTRQLTNISGNLWGKTLQGARAQRVEYLLLHSFHAKKFIVPDKISSRAKDTKLTKRRMNNGAEEKTDYLDANGASLENDGPHDDHGKGKKGPAYAGGLVLEPKKGLYDKYILLLDFNSLYPSIIQEYNICFTTVDRSSDGLATRLPSSKITGVLPELLKNLVDRRRMVKGWMKNASGIKLQQLDIQQQALKLTANSMYGCLGFSNSRFYAKPLAELITLQGREILQSTVDLVQNNLNLEVIYGDTDSIMIYSGLDDYTKAKAISGKVIQEVNKKYKCLEIDLDGMYKRMLLLKKKKYAAVKVQLRDGTPYEVIERKGLDMVRRDWSLLSKELGNFCLSQILSGGPCEDVVESIHNSLMKIQEEMRNGQVDLEKYKITKTLTKPPESYPDARNQPHVQVALRLKQSGYTSGCSVGDTIPYIICCEQGTSSGGSTGMAQRARHPDELKRDDGKWMIDIDYYLSQQIHPVVSRLCASIQGTSPERLADCLGLDSSKFRGNSVQSASNDPSGSLFFSQDDEERYKGCDPLTLSCPSCSSTIDCQAVFSSVCKSINEKSTKPESEECSSSFWYKMRCPRCPEDGNAGKLSRAIIANQVKRKVDGFVSTYYKGIMTCDDETCKYTTRSLNLRLIGDSERGTVCPNYPRCNGHLVRKYTEADLYKQLSYFCYLLDTVRCIEKVESSKRAFVEKEVYKIRPNIDLAASIVQKARDRSAYGWVQLQDLVVTV
ncbi:hypothetical protein ACFE04_022915 [Oxalis oulophora]